MRLLTLRHLHMTQCVKPVRLLHTSAAPLSLQNVRAAGALMCPTALQLVNSTKRAVPA